MTPSRAALRPRGRLGFLVRQRRRARHHPCPGSYMGPPGKASPMPHPGRDVKGKFHPRTARPDGVVKG